MIVMISKCTKDAVELERLYPNIFGMMYTLTVRDAKGLPFAIDNGRFTAKNWNKEQFYSCVGALAPQNPLFVSVPDVVGDGKKTIEEYKKYAEEMLQFKVPLACVVQDGMKPTDVRKLRPEPEWIFIGGTTEWKRKSMREWRQEFPKVHVGRINTFYWLMVCHRLGMDSIDGTGWMRFKRISPQYRRLMKYARMVTNGTIDKPTGFFY